MSTFPFVQVEGALALPHIRPLARLPASFGREWALTPPHFSLRTELRALYAAIMRTVCLSAEAFRAAVGWGNDHSPIPQPPRPVAAPVARAPSAVSVARETAGNPPAGRTANARSTPEVSPDHAQNHMPPFQQRKLTGGAVAIGGAALLAWIVASHAPHDTTSATGTATPHPNANAGQDISQRLAEARVQHERVTSGAVALPSAPAPTPAAVLPRTVEMPVQAPQTTVADTRKPLQAVAPPHAKADFSMRAHAQPASSARLVQREARGNERAVKRGSGQRVAERGTNPRRDIRAFAPYREAAPVTSHRTHGAYSEAQGYSSRQTGANPADEYASILSYAKTYAPAHVSNSPAVPVDSTEWVNHVSQRRITEVPDRFAK
ncbi:hypothetical protein [Paraburkholderia acidiphila]|uniref:Uncharacterized protein n=1 Tax=Paraburkholderia acidiphila TaxID=2571747 RepID=A0A7Z2J8I6_9BURK|nr:hypothetical protein [Paraburkholderia acidiphila]QGZ55281.1 hypothetical protein FAZ97_10365 [Paraburkholderia acidiphila]